MVPTEVNIPRNTDREIYRGLLDYFVIFSDPCKQQQNAMTEKELRKLEGTIRAKMGDIKKQRVTLRDSGIGSLMNLLKKVDEALYEKILPEYKKMVSDFNIFK